MIGAATYSAVKAALAKEFALTERELDVTHSPGVVGPWGGTPEHLRVYVPKRVDLSTARDRVKRIVSFYVPEGLLVTVDHNPNAYETTAAPGACACGQTNDYGAPAGSNGRWTCTGCKLWAQVAGNAPKVADVVTSAPATAPSPKRHRRFWRS